MTDPTLTVTIDRSGMPGSLSPLVFSATLDSNVLGIVNYQAPAYQMRIGYMPDSADVHGSEALTVSYQQALMSWDWVRDGATSETQAQAAREEVRAALAQFRYTVTTKVSDAPAEVWAADPGSLTPPARDLANLTNFDPVHAVTIPVYPIPGS